MRMNIFHEHILFFLSLYLFFTFEGPGVASLKGRRVSNITELVVTFPGGPFQRGSPVSPQRQLPFLSRIFGNRNQNVRVPQETSHLSSGAHQRPGGRPSFFNRLFRRAPVPSPERRRRTYAKMKAKAG
ncbi:uncharacterized protein LOC142769158 [Rhipicephalus microplus]|uniref:uncharacterized protein LOC142769158 n=1 Tax=Rhipicephalus microplus TaxID=6941 RepID=UPI003F6B37F5